MSQSIKYIVGLLAGTLFLSCTKQQGHVNTSNFPDDIDRIMTGSCATSGCHNTASSGAANYLDLSTWSKMFEGSGSGSPVVPFSSRFSSLCYFINSYSDLGTINAPRMPLNQSALPYEEVKRIKDWIDLGAPAADGTIPFAENLNRKKLYAVNQGCDVVTVFDSETHLPMRFVEIGPGQSTPHQLKVSPDGKYWYVVYVNRNFMKKFRCSDDSFVADIPLTPAAAGTGSTDAKDWNTFVISKDGKRAYCVSWTRLGAIATVDLENNKLIRFSAGWTYPHGICLSKDESKIYIAAQTGNYVSEIDSSFDIGTINEYALDGGLASVESSLDPHDMVLSADGNALVVTCQTSNEVIVFDLNTKKPLVRIPTAIFPQEITHSDKFHAFFVTCSGDNTKAHAGSILKIRDNDYFTQRLDAGAQPHGVAVDETTGLVYLLSRNISSDGPIPHHTSQCLGKNGFVNFIDAATFKLMKDKFELSVDPYYVYPRP